MGKKTKSNEPKREYIISTRDEDEFERLMSMFGAASVEQMNRFRLSVDDLLCERNMLLASIVNKIPEKFQKVRFIINDEGDKEDLLQIDESFFVRLKTETGDIYFSVQNDMWFDFGCDEITVKEIDMKPCTPVFRKLILRSLLNEYKNEKQSSCECHCHSGKQEKDDIVFTNLVSSETFFDEEDDDDDELIPCKDEGEDSDWKDSFNQSNLYVEAQDDDDDDDDD